MAKARGDTDRIDHGRASSFGVDPQRYDRARPSYPVALIDDLIGDGVEGVLDIGAGTGKVGRLFADRGCTVLGIEHDERMAEFARRHGLQVDVATFEDWDATNRTFDLVVSGQAWHWIDPQVGPGKAADVLNAGGRLGLFWNRSGFDPAVRERLDKAYQRLVPSIAEASAVLGAGAPEWLTPHLDALHASGRFSKVDVRSYPWQHTYSTSEYLDQLQTHSDHAELPPSKLDALIDAVGTILDEHGGSIWVSYHTTLILAGVLAPTP